MGIINEIRIAATEVNTARLESRLQILTNEIHTNYISTDGSIGMQSNLYMDENKIINISTAYPPSDQAQAVSWSQVLKFVGKVTRQFFKKVGGKITGDVNMDGNKILNIPDPVNDGDAVNKRTVDLKLNIGMFLGARALIGVPTLNDLVFILVPDLSLMRIDELEKVIEVTDPINDLHFIQNEGTKRPTLRFDLATKHHYIEFNGTNNNLVLKNYQIDKLGGWGAYTTTLFLLVKTYNQAPQSQFRWGGGTERFNAHIPHSNGAIFLDYGNYSSYRLEIYSQQNILGNLELWTMCISENDKEVFRGTSSIIPIYRQVRGFAELPQDSKNDFYIGSGINSNFCRMDLYSLLIYSRALPIVELEGMFRYFKNKYNV